MTQETESPDVVEKVTRALYERNPFEEAGESVDGFFTVKGGALSWDQARRIAAEFPDGEVAKFLALTEGDARAALAAIPGAGETSVFYQRCINSLVTVINTAVGSLEMAGNAFSAQNARMGRDEAMAVLSAKPIDAVVLSSPTTPIDTAYNEGVEAADRWITQTRLYEVDGSGNCFQAALASLLALPLESVPDFAAQHAEASNFWDAIHEWTEQHGFMLWAQGASAAPNLLHIASGKSPRGIHHAVVMRGNELVHDPHPSRAGLKDVQLRHMLIPLDPAIRALKRPASPAPHQEKE